MTAPRRLAVWLHGVRIATLRSTRPFRYQLSFTDEGLDLFGSAPGALSLGLPMTSGSISDQAFEDRPVSFFLGGLLPEGRVRSELASRHRVSPGEFMPLLAHVGGECAGAIQFLPEGSQPSDGVNVPLTDADVVRLVEDAPSFLEGHEPQASLAGVQEKVLLFKDGDRWSWPEAGAPSTHILKPEPRTGSVLEGLLQAEWWALQVANTAGIPAANAELSVFGTRPALVVERFDRTVVGGRIHQEDFCQALGLNPEDKYETTSMPSPHRLARLMARVSAASSNPQAERESLLRQITFNTIIGNGDSHSKNFSVLLDRSGEARLAPLYDVAPTMHLRPIYHFSGHVIGGIRDLRSLEPSHLVAEARAWGAPEHAAAKIVSETIESVGAAITSVALPDGLEQMKDSLDRTWRSRGWK